MKQAFTMIELIFVIVILGILAAIAVPKLGNVKTKAEVTKAVTAFSVVTNDALNNYQLNGNHFADDKGAAIAGNADPEDKIAAITHAVANDGALNVQGEKCGTFKVTCEGPNAADKCTGLTFTTEAAPDSGSACDLFIKDANFKSMFKDPDAAITEKTDYTLDLNAGKWEAK